jgi:hypothetical protein
VPGLLKSCESEVKEKLKHFLENIPGKVLTDKLLFWNFWLIG